MLPNVRTPYLRLRLPVIIRGVQRGEAKLVVDTAKLGEFLALGPEVIDRLAPLQGGPLSQRARAMRKRIDYVALRAQYEQLLADGTCATKADVARYAGVSRTWVSRVLKGIKGAIAVQ
jgi:predicted aminopeptidase